MISHIEGDELGVLRDAGIARCGIKRAKARRLREHPRQRMFTPTRTE
jgi:hypothetical protein